MQGAGEVQCEEMLIVERGGWVGEEGWQALRGAGAWQVGVGAGVVA